MVNYNNAIRTTERGLSIIGNSESCRRDPYKCPANILTVGVGSTAAGGEPINPKKRYTDNEIAQRWVKDIQTAEQCVNRFANGKKLPLSVFEALTSITFNVGCDAVRNSTMFTKARTGELDSVCNQFPRWVYAGGKKLSGLVIRREKEKALCFSDLR
ncbi:lysozyme [Mannheimia massilioguelmaensis]|uniref:lysozyme n=1 Tax=Mannheimia massilioguelmaensis TaxID=1604354 RepID=UPI0009E4BF43